MKYHNWLKLRENTIPAVHNRFLTPAERRQSHRQGDTPFVVRDRDGKVLGYAFDEPFAARMAQENGGSYDFDHE